MQKGERRGGEEGVRVEEREEREEGREGARVGEKDNFDSAITLFTNLGSSLSLSLLSLSLSLSHSLSPFSFLLLREVMGTDHQCCMQHSLTEILLYTPVILFTCVAVLRADGF